MNYFNQFREGMRLFLGIAFKVLKPHLLKLLDLLKIYIVDILVDALVKSKDILNKKKRDAEDDLDKDKKDKKSEEKKDSESQ